MCTSVRTSHLRCRGAVCARQLGAHVDDGLLTSRAQHHDSADPPTHGRVKVVGSWGHPVYIHLALAEPQSVNPSGEIRIYAGRDLDGLFEKYRRLGVDVVFPRVSQPWGLREFAVRETNRHQLRFCMES